MINICFDGRILKNGLLHNSGRSGIYFVVRNILLEMLARTKQFHVSLFLDADGVGMLGKINESLGINISPNDVLTAESDFSNIDTFFSPVYRVPDFLNKYPNVSRYTILYDTIPLLFPEYFHGNVGWFADLCEGLNHDDFYFSISKHTTGDFLNFFDVLDKDKVTEIPLSTNFQYQPNRNARELARVRKKYNIPAGKKYLFSLCSLEPRKNLIRSVKCFIQFIDKYKIDDLVFVLGGGAWTGFIERLEREVPEYKKYSDKIIRAGYVADDDLEILYSNAEWFVYTSQYEGFGMPPLEAMSCGCPVITSNNSSLPEVVGDAGIMIDYDSDEQHISAYHSYYFDEKLRNEKSKAGLERAKLFSWKSCVDIILNKMQQIEKLKSAQPLVTVITPSYNLIDNGRAEWLKQNIESVQNQTYKNIEHIVIDGASTDGTLDLLKEYQEKAWIKYYSEPDKGIYDALNKGIERARGKYIVCLNSDDFYCDNRAVEYLVKRAESVGADAVYGDAVRVKPDDLSVMNYWSGRETFFPLVGSCPCHQTLLIKTDVMKELGLYNIKYKCSADNVFMTRMVCHGKVFSGIDVKIICFRDGGFSANNQLLSKQDWLDGFYVEYGRVHGLNRWDCSNLFGFGFLGLPLNQAIDLGIRVDNPVWSREYFRHLINHHVEVTRNAMAVASATKRNPKKNIRYYLFDCVPLMRIKQRHGVARWLLFGCVPILKIKTKGSKVKTYLFGFIPLTRSSDRHGVYKLRVFGLPIIRIKHKK